MADTVTDPLEKAVLSGAIFAGKNPDGEEPRRTPSNSDVEDSDDGGGRGSNEGFPGGAAQGASTHGPVSTTKGQSHNTGVKGVLSDYRNRNNHPGNGNDKSSGTNSSTNATASKAVRKGLKGLSLGTTSKNRKTSAAESSDGEAEDGDEYDGLSDGEREALEAYRRKRTAEMQKMGSGERSATHGNGQSGARRQKFGHLREVGQDQFVKATEDRNAQSVVVHIYSPFIPSCTELNNHLSALARRYPHTKFLRAHSRALEFAIGDEEDVLPTLLVYRQGEVYKNLVAFDKEVLLVSEDDGEVDRRILTRDLVERALISHGVLQQHSAAHIGCSDEEDDSE